MPEDIQWETPEHLHKKKTADWYWSVIIIAVSLAVAAVFFADIVFAIFLLVATFALLLHAAKPPRNITIKLSPEGLQFGEYFYPYSSLDAFNIIEKEDQEESTLLIKSKKLLMPLITIQLHGVGDEEVAAYLAEHITPDEELNEPFFQWVMEYIGF